MLLSAIKYWHPASVVVVIDSRVLLHPESQLALLTFARVCSPNHQSDFAVLAASLTHLTYALATTCNVNNAW
jgi:hypothetical protein